MKLLRLKLLSEFRGLKKGYEIVFNKENKNNSNVLEPICFVGVNGSGKSNILEVISEIFYYLENFSQAKKSEIKKHAIGFGFEIEYIVPDTIYNQNLLQDQPIAKEDIQVRIVKKIGDAPISYALYENFEYKNDTPEGMKSFLPTQIIGYSSGMNELISNPYIKMDFQYLQEFDKRTGESVESSLDINRMFFLDYDLNKLITICNFLFDENVDESKHGLGVKNIEPLRQKIGIEKLHSFSVSIRLRRQDKNPIELPSELNLSIEKLLKCATLVNETKKETAKFGEYKEYYLSFRVNKETKKAFSHHFRSAYSLFRDLYFLRLLNNHLVGGDTQNLVKNAGTKTNISTMLPRNEASKRVFYISDIAMEKEGIEDPVFYKQLSDGEHQFLHVIGAMILLDSEGVLFLLDEPETHLNPEWRSHFVSTFNECMKTKDKKRKQEVILTTHSPFIVSDCKKEKVFIFEKKAKDNKVKLPKNPEDETYGTSIEMIYWKIFGKHQTISKMALSELELIKEKILNNEIGRKEAIQSLLKFGNSMERMQIVELLRKRDQK